MFKKQKLAQKILVHLSLWILYIFFFSVVTWLISKNFSLKSYLSQTFIILPINISLAYISVYKIIPSYYKHQNFFRLFSVIFLFLLFAVPIEQIALFLLLKIPVTIENILGANLFFLFMESGFIVGTAIAIVISKNWLSIKIEKNQIEKEMLKAELQVLKNQLQPHFLFNTLNNIYSFAIQEGAEKTAYGIEVLSNLLSKILYENNQSRISIMKEIEMIETYINLQKYRFEELIDLRFSNTIENRSLLIPPLILFTFVENSFKHCSNIHKERPWIKIEIITSRNIILFNAENSITKQNNNSVGGIGILNVKKRLELIYDNGYLLKTNKLDDRFEVKLRIDASKDGEN